MMREKVRQVQELSHPCGKCAFYDDSVWHPVDTGLVSMLAQGFTRNDLSKGQALFEQGDSNQGVFCVSKGLLAVRSLHADGSSILIRLVYPGEIIGFRSFLSGRNHGTEARALLPSRVCKVARRNVDQIVQASPAVLMKLAEKCISEIDRNQERIIATATRSNKRRLADLLFHLMDVHGERIGGRLSMQLPLSRRDLADLIGVQPETLSRLVKRLVSDGFFTLSGREVQMPIPEPMAADAAPR